MQKKPSRDWDAERQQLASALTQLEMIKLWLIEHQQSAPELAKELEKLTARLGRFGEVDEDDEEAPEPLRKRENDGPAIMA